MFCDKARKEVTRARKKFRVNTSRRRVLLPTSSSHICKKVGFNLQENKFIHSLQPRARKVFSLPARAEWRHGFSVHLYSDKARCFNQSGRALYRNFIIINK